MATELKDVKKLLQEWDVALGAVEKKGEGFFVDSRLPDLYKQLSINSTMSPQELQTALQVLENIAVKKSDSSRPIPFHQSLAEHKYRSFKKHYGIDTAFPKLPMVVTENSHLHQFLIKNQQMLLNFYERSHLHTIGDSPFSEVNYSPAQLKESQALYNMATNSRERQNTDQTTSLIDINRGGVTFNHSTVPLNNQDSPNDPSNFTIIEEFTGDRVTSPHSKASKILNFGGQYLDGVILEEFTNSTAFADSQTTGIQPGYALGSVDWSEENKGELHATVKLKIYTVTLENPFDLPNNYVMGSDGSSLIEIGMDDPELMQKVQLRCGKEKRGETEGNVTPICEIDAKLKLVNDNQWKHYELKAEEFKIQYFTPDLVSTKSPDYKESSKLSL